MLALLAPGQGSQTPGFLAPWLESELATSLINIWSDVTELDLTRLGSTADADEIRDTSKAQPLLVAGALMSAGWCFEGDYSNISYFAGHSVGEIGAAALAQVMDANTAMKLVRARGVRARIRSNRPPKNRCSQPFAPMKNETPKRHPPHQTR